MGFYLDESTDTESAPSGFFVDEPQPLSVGETLTGGANKVLNALTLGFGDELVAGGNALIDRAWNGKDLGQSYDDRLNQVRSLDQRYSQANPIESAILDIAPAFLTPFPKVMSAEKGLLPAATNIAKGAGIGAGYGGISGFGNAEGGFQNRAEVAGINAAIGSLFGGGLQTVAEGAQGLVGGGRSILNALTGKNIEPEANQIARETVAKYTDVPKLLAKLEKPVNSPFVDKMTVSEQGLDPGLGLLTRTLVKNPDLPAGIIKEGMDAERAMQRVAVFGEHQGQVRTPEEFGSVIREDIAAGRSTQSEKIGDAYTKAKVGDGTTSIFPAKKAVSDFLAKQEKIGVPVDSTTQKVIDNFRAQPNRVTLEQLDGQRKIIGGLLGDKRTMLNATPQEKAGTRALGKLFGNIADAEVAPTNTFSKSQIKNISKGRELTAERGDLFDKKGTGDILKKDSFGDYKLYDSKIRGKVFQSPEQATRFLDGLKKAPDKGVRGKQAIASDVFEQLRERSTNLAGEFTPTKFADNWDKLKTVAGDALSPIQKKAITSVRNDLVRQNLHEASAAHASRGQSITSQDLGSAAFVKDTINQAIKNRTGIIGKAFEVLGADRTNQIKAKVDENLVRLAFDRNFAREFLQPQTPKQIRKISEAVVLRALTPALLGSESLQGLSKSSSLPAALTLEQATQILQQEQKGKGRGIKAIGNQALFKTTTKEKAGIDIINRAMDRGEEEMKSKDFDAKVDTIAAKLSTKPEYLQKAMAFETGGTFDPKEKNKAGSGATGLIQFTGKTAKDLTKADSESAAIKILESMSDTEQLDYVEKYLKPFKGKLNSIDDVYMAILYPKAVGKDSEYALFKEGTKSYWQNRGLDIDKDGVITKAEATSKVKNYNV